MKLTLKDYIDAPFSCVSKVWDRNASDYVAEPLPQSWRRYQTSERMKVFHYLNGVGSAPLS